MATVSSKVMWPNYSTSNVKAAGKDTDKNALGKDAFLELLVTQLKNQDPLQPQDNAAFITQMAQFTSVEQLMNMSDQLSLLNQNLGTASSIIGKTVSWYELDDAGQTKLMYDAVNSIVSQDGTLYAKFADETMIKLSDVVTVSDKAPEANQPDDGSEESDGNGETAGTADTNSSSTEQEDGSV
ncbi:flagellar hook capping FlgD N-terminal domain-containing protein [Paenibacillus sp. JDR-2]|uniref:flagellar hook capping FlgD N-terminal domain-containing protein n=1 Tax=Paenibacillus sp. (strain JDR-2) TaxID=324057 RepID=UPI000166565F|nr:flagellar hook capping FlgD N-terminal domain-containing protein [Paenibacillus sp. JDR-2]ACT02083.1 flagellar hook capping protein [Paenibacillus sp. JDR-2]